MNSYKCLILLSATGLVCSTAEANLRPLSADRPDTTESPYSVDRGHWQVETELFTWTRNGGSTSSFSINETNLKLGLTDTTDLQIVLPFYTKEKKGGEGFGDVEVRLKYNLVDNDEDGFALGILPYIKLPTAQGGLGNDDWEVGIAVPFATQLDETWSLGLMAQIDFVSDGDSSGLNYEALMSAVVSRGITENTSWFGEFVVIFSAEANDDRQVYFNTGATWFQNETLQWDTGIRIGLSAASDDFTPFLGVSKKF